MYQADMILPFDTGQFDLVFARHVLEHSPMPLLTLMEWHRVAKQWLCVIVPDPRAFAPGGRNHYYVLSKELWRPIIARAGWAVIWEEDTREPFEHRFMCEKVSGDGLSTSRT
jgi:SAM-dependent methyltransferase